MHTPFRTILGVLACALLGGASKAGQASEISAAMIKLERDDPRVMEHLEYLTERIGHRLTGSPNNMQACEWAAQRFRSFGLEARVEQWGSFPVGFDRGPSSGGMLSPVKFDYVFTTNAWTAGTPGPMRGAALLMPRDAAEVEQLGEGLRGAWVVDRSKQDQTQAAEQHKQVLALLREAGIAGRVTNANSSGSARTKDYVYAFGNYRVDPENLPTEVKVNLLQVMYDDLVARLERGEEVLLAFDIDNRFLPGPFPVQNVIAELKGSELPDEYVIIGGHIDSWEPADGAQDNGTGIATTLEAARLLMEVGAKPRRTIRFMLWSGEEQGLLGSAGYVAKHRDEMQRISAVFVHDAGTNYLSGVNAPASMIEQLKLVFEPLFGLDPSKQFALNENRGMSPGGGTDNGPFIAAGVPAFAWRQTGRTSYFHSWHTQYDTIDFVVPEYQQHSALVAAITAYNVANLPALLSRENMLAPAPRRMGVNLDETIVTSVSEGSKAEQAGWLEGDVILSIDGEPVDSRRAVVRQLQAGGPRKLIVLRRGTEEIESILDYSPLE